MPFDQQNFFITENYNYFSMLSHKANNNKINTINQVKMNERGTLTIPVDIRKELNLTKNSSFQIINDDGIIKLIPIYDLTKDHNWIKKDTFSKEALDEAHLIDLEVEKRL